MHYFLFNNYQSWATLHTKIDLSLLMVVKMALFTINSLQNSEEILLFPWIQADIFQISPGEVSLWLQQF